MDRDRACLRIRISTLMLLVIIAALAAALVVERRKRGRLERQLASTNARLPRYTTYHAPMKARSAGYPAKAKVSR